MNFVVSADDYFKFLSICEGTGLDVQVLLG